MRIAIFVLCALVCSCAQYHYKDPWAGKHLTNQQIADRNTAYFRARQAKREKMFSGMTSKERADFELRERELEFRERSYQQQREDTAQYQEQQRRQQVAQNIQNAWANVSNENARREQMAYDANQRTTDAITRIGMPQRNVINVNVRPVYAQPASIPMWGQSQTYVTPVNPYMGY